MLYCEYAGLHIRLVPANPPSSSFMSHVKSFLNPQRYLIYFAIYLQLVRSFKEIVLDQEQELVFKNQSQQTSFHFSSISYLIKHTMQWHAQLT